MNYKMFDREREELEIEDMSRYGDPRRCPRHPEVKVSSGDGMHDGLCNICESEQDDAAQPAPPIFASPLTLEDFFGKASTESLLFWWDQLGLCIVDDLPLYDLSAAVGAELRKRNVDKITGGWWEGF